jgi:hypothetical protein
MADHVRWAVGRPRSWGAPAPRVWRPWESITPRVNVHVQVWDASTLTLEQAARAGRGRLLRASRGHNLVTTSGRNLLRDLLNDDAISGITEFALGTDGTAAVNADTALGAEVLRDAITNTTKDIYKLTAQYFLSSTALNGTTIREGGLFTDEDTLFARYVLDTPIAPKTSGIAVTFTWDITFTVTAMDILERGSIIELGGDADDFSIGNAYPSGATLDKLVNGSGVWAIDSAALAGGTFALEGHVRVTNGSATPTIALFNITDGSPDAALAGSAVAGTAGNQTGTRVRSAAITFPTAGAVKELGVKVKTDEALGEAIVWGLRIVRIT